VYELSDHLGNVNVTVTDQKYENKGVFEAVVVSASEVYPFGMTKPNTNIYLGTVPNLKNL
jgi:hypothetical protein